MPSPKAKVLRNQEIMALRDSGWSYGAIASKLVLSKQTVNEIYLREKHRRGEKPNTKDGRYTRVDLRRIIHSQGKN